MSTRLLAVCALCAPMFASQAFASASNEYTLSDTDTNTTVTTYQSTYQAPVTQQTYQQPAYQTQPAYQPPVADTNNGQFGELVFDTQPYFPNGDTGSTESYTTTTTDSYSADNAFTTQPYMGATDTTTTYQPAYQANQTGYQDTQTAYQGGQPSFQMPEPTYQPSMEQESDAAWK